MAHSWHKKSNNWRNWTSILLVGDVGVGKDSFATRYIYDRTPFECPELGQRKSTWKSLPLSSSPLLNGQPGQYHRELWPAFRTLASKNDPETIEMWFSFFSLLSWDIHPSRISRAFEGSDVIALCYDSSRPETLHNAIYKWHPMVLQHGPSVPIFLLGCKSDLKLDGSGQSAAQFVTMEDAKKAARQIGAIDAFECSANDYESAEKVGDLLVWYAYYSHFWNPEASYSRLQALLR
ncbi:P-loop containing nucleoside triphosphate hydrolase protein [Serendipita vermifera]|nr:P-loop containing nucleoside triphosphate hydrolase protein [Serendipita vermifera]